MMRAGFGWFAGGISAGLAVVVLAVSLAHGGSAPAAVEVSPPPVIATDPTPAPSAAATAAPAPTADVPASGTRASTPDSGGGPGHSSAPAAPRRSATLFDLRIAAVGISAPVIGVGVVHGAMDAPFGPASSPVWHEAFWLDVGAQPGQPGTMTIAGHLDDILGRPGAFWTLHKLQTGAVVEITRRSDGVTVRYRITEVDSYTNSQANSPAVLHRVYGSAGGGTDDGVARISLVTCTGRYVNGEYNHRFVAYGELIS